jgi:dTDP-4-dehydrorhamnose 3,5-epimerase
VTARFAVIDTPLSGLKLLRRKKFGDHRGYLTRLFDAEELATHGWTNGIHQINETGTGERGTVRGFHYQTPPFSEGKLIACTRGKILDVAVDIRRGSPTFLQHCAAELSDDNNLSFLLPEGFAHGYQALTDDVRMIYAHSAPYRAEAEAGLNIADPRLGVTWPLPVANLSARDQGFAMLTDMFEGVSP